jgi:hypothetical protein
MNFMRSAPLHLAVGLVIDNPADNALYSPFVRLSPDYKGGRADSARI